MWQLRMQQQYACIGMHTELPAIRLQKTLPALEINSTHPRVEIHSPRPRVYIDQRQCFADAGLRTPGDFARHCAQIAVSQGLQAIGEISGQGDRLAGIEKGYTLEQMAADLMDSAADFNVTAIPKQPPRCEWDTRPVEVTLHRGAVDTKLHQGRIENHTRHRPVDIYLRQMNHVQIDWVENRVNTLA